MTPAAKLRHVSILLVDDEPIARLGLETMIRDHAGWELCGEASDTADGLAEAKRKRPDAAILDIAIEGERGLDFIEQVKEHTAVLVFSHREETIYAERCLQAGALGFVSKREPVETVERAIENILKGQVHLSRRINQRLLKRVAQGADPVDIGAIDALTDRELEVFELLGEGLTTNQIARQLKISPKTVQSYHANIKQALNLSNNNQLIRRAVHYVLEGR